MLKIRTKTGYQKVYIMFKFATIKCQFLNTSVIPVRTGTSVVNFTQTSFTIVPNRVTSTTVYAYRLWRPRPAPPAAPSAPVATTPVCTQHMFSIYAITFSHCFKQTSKRDNEMTSFSKRLIYSLLCFHFNSAHYRFIILSVICVT